MVALAAFHEFMKAYYELGCRQYRPFTLTLVGMTDDYISEQIRLNRLDGSRGTVEGVSPNVPHQKRSRSRETATQSFAVRSTRRDRCTYSRACSAATSC